MTPQYRASLVVELEDIERQLVGRRKQLDKWEKRLALCLSEPSIYGDLYEKTNAIFQRKKRLVETGERLRAYIRSELYRQIEYRPAFEWKN